MSNILVTGANGLLGSHLTHLLDEFYPSDTILTPTSKELNLINQVEVHDYFQNNQISKVFHCAGLVSGMFGHTPAEDLRYNTLMGLNTLFSAAINGVKHFINVGSTCVYPKLAQAPVKETQILTGSFEPSCEAFALAKAVSIKYAEILNKYNLLDYKTVMLPNLYGPGERVRPSGNHCVLDIMIKMIHAKAQNDDCVSLYGTGTAVRSFMHAQDAALALIYVDRCLNSNLAVPIVNVGSEQILKISELADKIKEIVGFTGDIVYDSANNTDFAKEKDGHPDKTEDLQMIKSIGYEPNNCIDIDSGLKQMYTYVDLLINTEYTDE